MLEVHACYTALGMKSASPPTLLIIGEYLSKAVNIPQKKLNTNDLKICWKHVWKFQSEQKHCFAES